jgi:hypothetical protein
MQSFIQGKKKTEKKRPSGLLSSGILTTTSTVTPKICFVIFGRNHQQGKEKKKNRSDLSGKTVRDHKKMLWMRAKSDAMS